MGVLGGRKVLKYLVFIFNFLFFLIGGALLGFGIYAKVGKSDYIDLTNVSKYSDVLIGIGCVTLVLALFGCCVAITENSCIMWIFHIFVFLFIIFLLEIGIGIFRYVKRDAVDEEFSRKIKHAIEKRYNNDTNSAINKVIDKIQRNFKCCGYDGFADWLNSTYYKQNEHLPGSCCIDERDKSKCPKKVTERHLYNTKGCFKKRTDWVRDNKNAVGSITVAFAIIQILDFAFSMKLCFTPTTA